MELHALKHIIRTRELFIELLEGLTLEDINQIPAGFRNNIGWNFGHIVVSTQGLCYRRTNLLPDREIPFDAYYAKGTKPENWISAAEINTLKLQAIASVQQIEQDYNNGVFSRITPFATSTYGIEMDTIEEVLTMTLAHDNLHLGYANALKKVINEQKSQIHK